MHLSLFQDNFKVQVDLADFLALSKANRGYRFLLVAIDCLSKRIYTAPLKNKGYDEIRRGFDKIFSDMPHLPISIFSDRGKEFESAKIRHYLEKEKGILQYRAVSSHIKAAVAERCIRTVGCARSSTFQVSFR